MNNLEIETSHQHSRAAPDLWELSAISQTPRLVFWQRGMHRIPRIETRSTRPEAILHARQRYLLDTLSNSMEGIDVQRVESFMTRQGLRIAPYRLISETDIQRAKQLTSGQTDETTAGYIAAYDIAIIPRNSKLEAINGTEFTESIMVHELEHGSNEHRHLVYLQAENQGKPLIHLGRAGHEVYDSHGNPRGNFINEGRAERQRGKFVEHELGRPQGFGKNMAHKHFFYEGAAAVAAKYTVHSVNDKPDVPTEALAAQTLDLLCKIDPELDRDLTLAPKSPEGLRNVAKRLNRIQSGLYVYLRDSPDDRKSYRQRLVYTQTLVGLLPRRRTFYALSR